MFGYEKVLRDFESILAYQQAVLDELKAHFGEKHQALLERIDDGTLKLHLLRDRVSHKKVFFNLLHPDRWLRILPPGNRDSPIQLLVRDQLQLEACFGRTP